MIATLPHGTSASMTPRSVPGFQSWWTRLDWLPVMRCSTLAQAPGSFFHFCVRQSDTKVGWLPWTFHSTCCSRRPSGASSADATLLNASVESIPFCSRRFDCVTCFGAFPHFPNKEKALLEMVRVLRPGGKLAIAHLKSAEEINQLHGQIGGAVARDRLPDSEALRLLMESSGLIDISIVNQPGRFIARGRKA